MSESTRININQRQPMPALEKVLGVLSLVGPISVLAGLVWYGGRMGERLDNLAVAHREMRQATEKDHDVLLRVEALTSDIRERLLHNSGPHGLSVGPSRPEDRP